MSNVLTLPTGGGAGDITAVTTSTGSGLSGGVTVGDADLTLAIGGLTNQSSTGLNANDRFIVQDVSDTADPNKHLTVGSLFAFATDGETTIEAGNGRLRVPDQGIGEPQLASFNSPGLNQVLGWNGSAMLWVDKGFAVSAWDNAETYNIGHIVTQNARAFLSRVNGNTGNDPDLETSAANWFLIRTSEEIVHTAGRFYAPGTVVNSTGGAADVFICRRPTTDTPSEFDADWYHLPRGASILEATTTASPYRSGTLVYVSGDIYFCHTSVPSPGIAAADIVNSANFATLSSGGVVGHTDAFGGLGTQGSPLSLDVTGIGFPIIPVVKGGTGATTAVNARTNLGLGTAATLDFGFDENDVAQLGPSGIFHSDRLSFGGTAGEVLTKTATGQAWSTYTQNGGIRIGAVAIMSPLQVNSNIVNAHGLGREPDFVTAYLECLIAEHGYAVGDRVSAFDYNRSASGADDISVWVATQSTTLPFIISKTGGGDLEVTAANWSFTAVPFSIEGGVGDAYVESASLSLSGNDLRFTLPRTGGLTDVTSNTVTFLLLLALSFPRTYRIRAITTSPSPPGETLPASRLVRRYFSSRAYLTPVGFE